MATISSIGIGSGIDVDSLLSKLMSLQQQPITDIQTRSTSLKTQLSVYGQVKSSLSTLRDAASKLTTPSLWTGVKATSSDSSSVAVSASGTPAAGNLSVSVSQLAAAQSVATGSFANASATVGAGTLTLQLGSWNLDGAQNPTTFTPKSGSSAVNISINADDKLSTVRDKINAANAGVTASIVTDASGARLTITSKTTGENSAFRLQATDGDGNDTDAAGLSRLAYDPENSANAMTLSVKAVNARAMINGLSVSSETNSLNSTIDGLNILLLKVTPPVSLTIASDIDAIKKAISDFTSAYNAINSMMRTQTKYDEATKTAGALQGDSTANSLQYQLRGIVGGSTTLGGSLQRLSDLGMAPGKDGALASGGTKLDAILNSGNLNDLKAFFMGVDNGNSGNNGFATKLRSFADQVLGVDGGIATRSTGIQKQIDRNNDQIDRLAARNNAMEVRLRAQYSTLDLTMSKYNSLSTYLSQQLTAMNNSNK